MSCRRHASAQRSSPPTRPRSPTSRPCSGRASARPFSRSSERAFVRLYSVFFLSRSSAPARLVLPCSCHQGPRKTRCRSSISSTQKIPTRRHPTNARHRLCPRTRTALMLLPNANDRLCSTPLTPLESTYKEHGWWEQALSSGPRQATACKTPPYSANACCKSPKGE